MPTRPPSPDPANASGSTPSDSASAFGGMGAGLSFFQDWIKAAGSALPNMPGATGAAGGGSGAWSMPSLDPEELEKRIQDLRTVQFWLEQNARLISITIQGLEVQRMTLSTLQGMNVSMDSLRESLKAKPTAPTSSTSPPPAAESAAAATEPAPAGAAGEPIVNPLRWWDTLTEQFKNLAAQTVQAAQASASSKESSAAAAPGSPPAKKAASATPTKAAAPARKASAAKTPATKAASVRRRSSNTGDAD